MLDPTFNLFPFKNSDAVIIDLPSFLILEF